MQRRNLNKTRNSWNRIERACKCQINVSISLFLLFPRVEQRRCFANKISKNVQIKALRHFPVAADQCAHLEILALLVNSMGKDVWDHLPQTLVVPLGHGLLHGFSHCVHTKIRRGGGTRMGAKAKRLGGAVSDA